MQASFGPNPQRRDDSKVEGNLPRVGIVFDPSSAGASEILDVFHRQGTDISPAEANVLMQRIRFRDAKPARDAKPVLLEDLLELLRGLRGEALPKSAPRPA